MKHIIVNKSSINDVMRMLLDDGVDKINFNITNQSNTIIIAHITYIINKI